MKRTPIETAHWDKESGTFSVIDVNSIIISIETFAKIQRDAEKILGDGAAIIFYEAGKDAGCSWASRFKQGWELNGEKFVSALRDFYAELGWGTFEIGEMKNNGTIVRVSNSFTSRGYGKSNSPVCHFLCGYNAGIIETLSGKPMDAEETKCAAKGDNYCEFIVKEVE